MSEVERSTFAGGCFWCVEAVFQELAGVTKAISGYAGGHVESPTYEQVCSGTTGHAEVVQVEFDPNVVSYEDLLEVFFATHNPTTKDRQGPDVGSQYRSAIFYHSEDQRAIAEAFIEELANSEAYDDPIVTEVEPLDTFYEAEEYHQDYYETNPNQPYCSVQIPPKLEKVRKTVSDQLLAD